MAGVPGILHSEQTGRKRAKGRQDSSPTQHFFPFPLQVFLCRNIIFYWKGEGWGKLLWPQDGCMQASGLALFSFPFLLCLLSTPLLHHSSMHWPFSFTVLFQSCACLRPSSEPCSSSSLAFCTILNSPSSWTLQAPGTRRLEAWALESNRTKLKTAL